MPWFCYFAMRYLKVLVISVQNSENKAKFRKHFEEVFMQIYIQYLDSIQ